MIGIVILNYMNWEDAKDLVNSIKNQTYKNYKIVIVDNNSPNNSFKKLSFLYSKDESIEVIKLQKNLGFAKGNNVGISYLRECYDISNILVLNADTLMIEKDYLEKLMSINYSYDVAVIGTKIIGSDGINQNPVYNKVGLKPSVRTYVRLKFARVIDPMKQILSSKKVIFNSNSRKKDFYLHGSVLFFTQNYFNNFSGFYPHTFLYFEEDILAIILKKMGLKFQYHDDLSIFHKEGQSSELSWNNSSTVKNRLITKSIMESFKVLVFSKNKIYKIMNSRMEY